MWVDTKELVKLITKTNRSKYDGRFIDCSCDQRGTGNLLYYITIFKEKPASSHCNRYVYWTYRTVESSEHGPMLSIKGTYKLQRWSKHHSHLWLFRQYPSLIEHQKWKVTHRQHDWGSRRSRYSISSRQTRPSRRALEDGEKEGWVGRLKDRVEVKYASFVKCISNGQ